MYKAIEEENFEMVSLFINHGASLDIKIEYQGQTVTPRQLLLSKGQKKSVATALNDHAKGGVDRLGYKAYSIGIYNTVKAASLPLCVGLIAQWGHGNYHNLKQYLLIHFNRITPRYIGKSFLIHLLKKLFDDTALEHNLTKGMTSSCIWYLWNYYRNNILWLHHRVGSVV